MLKTDFHIHSGFDRPNRPLTYSSKNVIDMYSKIGFKIISITNHDNYSVNSSLISYAKKKDLLLLPGIEKTIEGKHTLLINIDKKTSDKINSFSDLERYKSEHFLVIAPHPFF